MVPRTLFTPDHETFRDSVRRFMNEEVAPHEDRWQEQGYVDREVWQKAGANGFLCVSMPEEYGGAAADRLYSVVLMEEQAFANSSSIGFGLHSEIVAPYLNRYGSEALKKKYLPKMVTGEMIGAIAMTEPGAGSDLQAIKTTAVKKGDKYILNGSKTFITNGWHSDLVIVVAKTDPSKGAKGTSLIIVDTSSMKRADGVLTRLSELLGGGLKLSALQTTLSPAKAMADWLSTKEAPAGFTLDRECELKQPDSEKATVRYARHTLDIDEVGEHIKQGKLPTQLGMTWSSRVSFVLTEAGTLKKIKLLDVVLESSGPDGGKSAGDDKSFDSDVALATGELARLIPELVDALGGPLVREAAPAAAEAARAPSPGSATNTTAPWDDPVPA